MGGAASHPQSDVDQIILKNIQLEGEGNESVRRHFLQLYHETVSSKSSPPNGIHSEKKHHDATHKGVNSSPSGSSKLFGSLSSAKFLAPSRGKLVKAASKIDLGTYADIEPSEAEGSQTTEVTLYTAALPTEKILELVKWILRKYPDAKRAEKVMNLFINCLDGQGLNYEEFILMYEGITIRVEMERHFEIQFKRLDPEDTGFLEKAHLLQMVNHILMNFAHIWCTRAEIVEMRRKLEALFLTRGEETMSKIELYEIFDAMLVTIRLIHLAKKKFRDFDVDKNGLLDESELLQLADWMSKSYERSGIKVKDEEKIQLRNRILEKYDLKGNGRITLRDMALLFEEVLEVRELYFSLKLNYSE